MGRESEERKIIKDLGRGKKFFYEESQKKIVASVVNDLNKYAKANPAFRGKTKYARRTENGVRYVIRLL